jgi:Galactose oxidase, central domain
VAGGSQYSIAPNGDSQSHDLASVEILTPGTGTWQLVQPIPHARSGHEAVLLADGRVLVFGGTYVDAAQIGRPATTAVIYDPGTGKWREVHGPPLATPAGSARLPDGRVVTVGMDHDANPTAQAIALFDPTTLTWRLGRPHPGPILFPSVTVLLDGSVLVAGGLHPTGELSSPMADSWRYDPAADRWQRTGYLATPAFGRTAVRLDGGRVLLVSMGTSNVFDQATGLWSTVAPPTLDRLGLFAVAIAGGRVLFTGTADCGEGHDATAIYDPATDGWRLVEADPDRGDDTLTRLADGRVLRVGGIFECGNPGADFVALNAAEIFDPAGIH